MSRPMIKGAALQTGKNNGFLDHLAPLADLMNVPCLVNDYSNLNKMHQFYPQISSYYIQDLSLQYLMEHFEVIFECQARFHPLHKMAKDFYQSSLRTVFAPHGNSDKGFFSPKNFFYHFMKNDITLIYGNHMVDALKKLDYWNHIKAPLLVGNYRYLFYHKYQTFYDQLAFHQIFSHLPKNNPTILYAPTWKDVENSTSFFDMGQKIIDDLPDNYNLIIKIHPNLETRDPHLYYPLLGSIEKKKKKNLLLLPEFPPIFPILSSTDIYLGDFSSIGYDFLMFQRPMFFIDVHKRPKTHRSIFLHQCGEQIPSDLKTNIFSFIEKRIAHWPLKHTDLQRKIAEYAFADLGSLEAIKNRILTALL